MTELADRWVPHATATDYAEALAARRRGGGELLVDEHDFTIEDAFIFLSVACDAGVAQACKPAEGFGTIARFSIPKIDACPAPFSTQPDGRLAAMAACDLVCLARDRARQPCSTNVHVPGTACSTQVHGRPVRPVHVPGTGHVRPSVMPLLTTSGRGARTRPAPRAPASPARRSRRTAR